MKFREWKRRGQVMVLWALLTPLLIGFVGLGIDLGWYYLNVSRLQNAADAAALAGAMNLVEQNKNKDLNDYYVSSLTSPPTDLKKYEKVSLVNDSGVSYIKTIDSAQIAEGKAEAQSYANKNLSDTSASGTVSDNWNTSSDESKHVVNFSSSLYAKVLDTQREDGGVPSNGLKYYEVTLTEQVNHLFLRGFKPMEAKVVAYALLKPHDKDLVTAISILEKLEVIANWEYQDKLKNFMGNWNQFQDNKNHYTTGNDYRTETVNIQQTGGSGKSTSANGGHYYNASQLDSINIDVKQDLRFYSKYNIKSDWDLGYDLPTNTKIEAYINTEGASDADVYDLRIHNSINFNDHWTDRNLNDLTPDILWTRIESDPIWTALEYNKSHREVNTVRQFILNVHKNNTDTTTVKDAKGNHKVYKYRPFFIFYMGPETYSENSEIRKSQPVILNLYEDWNAVLYMPNSPVVINGNGHKLTGFVIAKEFVRLTEDSDYTNNGYIATDDSYGHKIFVKQSDTISEEKFNELKSSKGYIEKTDSEGNVNLYEMPEARKYLLLSIDKTQYNGSLADYLAANYKDKLKAFRGITDDDKISTITFPNEEKNLTDISIPVVDSDLSPTKVNDNYIKVLKGNTTMYIEKKNLPYIRVRRNGKRPYVCIYDIKKYQSNDTTNYAGIRLIDDSYTNFNDANNKWDTKADLSTSDTNSVVRSLLLNTYDQKYIDGQLTLREGDGYKYFTLNWELPEESSEPVATYRKITRTRADSTTEVMYIQDGKSYYMKTVPNGSSGKDAAGNNVENAIIIDNKGNLQTKALPAGSTRETNENEQPSDTGVGKRLKINGSSEQEYRVPGLEVVYYKSVFNLSEDSCYSYFQIADLVRVNYTYMNVNEVEKKPDGKWKVDDMFFPTRRAKWID